MMNTLLVLSALIGAWGNQSGTSYVQRVHPFQPYVRIDGNAAVQLYLIHAEKVPVEKSEFPKGSISRVSGPGFTCYELNSYCRHTITHFCHLVLDSTTLAPRAWPGQNPPGIEPNGFGFGKPGPCSATE